ncbi:MAG TPA: transposase [Bacteroidota bacterium]
MQFPIKEKKHRLDKDLYRGIKVVSFTLCIKDRIPFFTSMNIFKKIEEILLIELGRFQCSAEVYLFMPDHCHLVLRGDTDESDVLHAVKFFKQKSGYWLYTNHPNVHWQKDFYDHILRDEVEIPRHVHYVLDNPIRKGIVLDWKKYPYKGSTIHNFDEW